MNLFIVRTGINWEESAIPELKKALEEQLPKNFIVFILHGENENIKTHFEIVNLY